MYEYCMCDEGGEKAGPKWLVSQVPHAAARGRGARGGSRGEGRQEERAPSSYWLTQRGKIGLFRPPRRTSCCFLCLFQRKIDNFAAPSKHITKHFVLQKGADKVARQRGHASYCTNRWTERPVSKRKPSQKSQTPVFYRLASRDRQTWLQKDYNTI